MEIWFYSFIQKKKKEKNAKYHNHQSVSDILVKLEIFIFSYKRNKNTKGVKKIIKTSFLFVIFINNIFNGIATWKHEFWVCKRGEDLDRFPTIFYEGLYDARAPTNVNLLYYSDWWRSTCLMYQESQRDRKRCGTNTTDNRFCDSSLRALTALLRIWDSENNRAPTTKYGAPRVNHNRTEIIFNFLEQRVYLCHSFSTYICSMSRKMLVINLHDFIIAEEVSFIISIFV